MVEKKVAKEEKTGMKIGEGEKLDGIHGIPKILIGIPILTVSFRFFESFLKFWTQLISQRERKISVAYRFMYRRPVQAAETQLAEEALNLGCSHMLLMDDDIYDVTYKDLFKLLDADKDVIGGAMFASKFPFALCCFRRYDTKEKVKDQPKKKGMFRLYEIPERSGVQQVDLLPFGFTLIKMKVFTRLPKPWFFCDESCPTDSWFVDQVMDSGLKVFAHMDVKLNHDDITERTRPHRLQIGLIKHQEQDNLIKLSPHEMKVHEMMIDKKMKEAEAKLKKSNLKFEKTIE